MHFKTDSLNLATILKLPLQKWFQDPNIEFSYAFGTGLVGMFEEIAFTHGSYLAPI